MKEWFTAAEIAGHSLPGCPITEQGVRKLAERDDWRRRPRKGRGGGWEYPIAALPEEARIALIRAQMSDASAAGVATARKIQLEENLSERAAHASRQAGLAQFVRLDDRRQHRAEARAAIVKACADFIRVGGLPQKRGREVFAYDYNHGAVAVEPWVRDAVQSVCANSIDNWAKQLEHEGLARLGGKYGQHRKGTGKIDSNEDVRKFVLGMLVDHPHASAKLVMRGLRARFDGSVLPAYRSLQRWLADWKAQNRQLHAAITNPDRWRSHYQAAGGDAAAAIVRLNQRWELDGTKGDLILTDNTRHTITGVIDVYSRRMKLHVSRSSTAVAVAAVTRKALLDWGVPEVAGTDNGSDFVSHHMQRVFAGLSVHQDIAPPFTPEHKPFIERSFRTFLHDLVELLNGFIGHNVAERKDIEARRSFADRLMKVGGAPVELRLSPEELQEFCDRWTDTVYGIEPHSGLGGKSPFEVAAAWSAPVARITDERALDVLLAEAPGDGGFRTVGKKGIRLDRALFEHPSLGSLEGERVRILLDEADIGEIYVFTADGEFVCKAVCPERTGISRQELAAMRKAHQKKTVADQKRALREAARTAGTKDIVQEILVERAAAAGKLAMFPQRALSHETEALAEAARAARVGKLPEAAPMTDAERQRQAALEAELAKPAQIIPLDSPETRFARALGIERRIAAGETIPEGDARWFESYRRQPEYRAAKKMFEDFGDEFLTGS